MSDQRVNVQTLEIPYNRTLGPVVGRFLTGLRDGELVGNKTKSGKVLCPPFEYDANTGEETAEGFVSLPDTGVVTTWAWVNEPLRYHPLDKPFAWALIRIDGADTALLHAVDAGSESKMSTGMPVRVRWAAERIGHIRDIACFEPVV